jgi:hypothetical protein
LKGASRNLVTLFYAPKRFFQARADDRGVLEATRVAFLFQVGGSVVDWIYLQQGWGFDPSSRSESLGRYMLISLASGAVFLPAMAGIIQLALFGLGAARASLATTYCVVVYTSVATAAISTFVPWVGPLVAVVAWVPLLVIGLRETHRVSTGRALAVSAMAWLRFVVLLVLGAVGASTVIRRHAAPPKASPSQTPADGPDAEASLPGRTS